MAHKTMLADHDLASILDPVYTAQSSFTLSYGGESALHQPIHVLYGGAHLFTSDTPRKLSALALKCFEQYAPDRQAFASAMDIEDQPLVLNTQVYERLSRKLAAAPIEDLRIDFEDGYGYRSDTEEDNDAVRTGAELAKAHAAASLPNYCGIRIKPFDRQSGKRAIRTLDLFIGSIHQAIGAPRIPMNFVVTLPKVVLPQQVKALSKVLSTLEEHHRLERNCIKIELMIEQPQVLIDHTGQCALMDLVAAGEGRCRGVHFGAYDFTAACGVVASDQRLDHALCDFARQVMQTALAQTGVWLSDGATTILPVPFQKDENAKIVLNGWRIHYKNVYRALQNGFYQGWDLHPAQIPARYAALYAFFLTGLPEMSKRLRTFVERAGRATLLGDQFDDAATGQGLLNYFLRALDCGAISQDDLIETGLTIEDLRLRNFAQILQNRRR
jgi:citrate lyase beta subunit